MRGRRLSEINPLYSIPAWREEEWNPRSVPLRAADFCSGVSRERLYSGVQISSARTVAIVVGGVMGAGLLVAAGCAHYRPAPIEPGQGLATLERRSLADPGLRAFVAHNLPAERAARATPPADTVRAWDLTALTLAAFYYSPDLDVARARWAIAEAGVVTAGARPNPTLSVSPGRVVDQSAAAAEAEAGVSLWTLALDLDIPLEIFHQRGYRIARARLLADSARFGMAQAAWGVRVRTRAALLDYGSARERTAIQRALVGEREELVRLLERRLAVGEASQLDVSRERARREQARLELRADERAMIEARSGLATAIGVPAEALDGISIDAQLPEPSLAALPPLDSLRRLALLGRADVQALLAEYGAAESALALEVARQYPGLHLLPGLSWDRGDAIISLGVSTLLPVLNRNRGPIMEAMARRRETAARVLQLQAVVLGQLDSALAGYREASLAVADADSLLAAERRAATAVVAQLRAGEADRVSLVSTLIEVATGELARLDVLAARDRALGHLEDAIQRPLAGGPVPPVELGPPPGGRPR
jgi:outer membrane protein TolC